MLLKYFLFIFLLLQYTLSVDVDLAVFNITVLDSAHRPVTGLATANFHVYEDGREEKIKIFQPEDTPATVGLIIDNSGSMASKSKEVVTAALAFISASKHDDEMFVVDFNRRAWLGLPKHVRRVPRHFMTQWSLPSITSRTGHGSDKHSYY